MLDAYVLLRELRLECQQQSHAMSVAIVCRAKRCHFFIRPRGQGWAPITCCPSNVVVGIDMALCGAIARTGRCTVLVFNAHADEQLDRVEPHARTLFERLSAFASAGIVEGVVCHPRSQRITPAKGVMQAMDAGFAWPDLLVVYDGPTADLLFKDRLLGQLETEPTVAATVLAGERALDAYRALALSASKLKARGVEVGEEPYRLAYQWVFQQQMSAESALECLSCVYGGDPAFSDHELFPLACLSALPGVQGIAIVPDQGSAGVGIDVSENSCVVCYGEKDVSQYLVAELPRN